MGTELDRVDRGILHRLQDDARHTTAADISGDVDVTANTVRNRIQRLESEGVITGYVPLIDYGRTEKSIRVLVRGTAPIHEREELAVAVLGVDGVVSVRELMTGSGNLQIELVAEDTDEITAAVSRLQQAGVDVESEVLLKAEHRRPFDNFGIDAVDD